jgi:hypothetical protein
MLLFSEYDILSVKTEAISVFLSKSGIMKNEFCRKLIEIEGQDIQNTIKNIINDKKNNIKIGSSFYVVPKNNIIQNIKYIYFSIIKNFTIDTISIYDLNIIFQNALQHFIRNNIKSVSFINMSEEIIGLEKTYVANLIMDIVQKNHHRINISLMDKDKDFINLLKNNIRIEM